MPPSDWSSTAPAHLQPAADAAPDARATSTDAPPAPPRTVRFDATQAIGATPEAVFGAERELVRRRRLAAGVDAAAPLFGLALSGGGIRSATVSLGVMQALAEARLLRQIDYLSTVSGGGYAGVFLGSLYARKAGAGDPAVDAVRAAAVDLPFVAQVEALLGGDFSRRSDHYHRDPRPLGWQLQWLRNSGRYLAPSGAGDYVYALALTLRNLLAIHTIIALPLLLVSLAAIALDCRLAHLAGLGSACGFLVSATTAAAATAAPVGMADLVEAAGNVGLTGVNGAAATAATVATAATAATAATTAAAATSGAAGAAGAGMLALGMLLAVTWLLPSALAYFAAQTPARLRFWWATPTAGAYLATALAAAGIAAWDGRAGGRLGWPKAPGLAGGAGGLAAVLLLALLYLGLVGARAKTRLDAADGSMPPLDAQATQRRLLGFVQNLRVRLTQVSATALTWTATLFGAAAVLFAAHALRLPSAAWWHSWTWAAALPAAARVVAFLSAGTRMRQGVPRRLLEGLLAAAGCVFFATLIVFWVGVAYRLDGWAAGSIGAIGIVVAALALLTLATGCTFQFLNLSSIQRMYASRIARAYLGATNPARAAGGSNYWQRISEAHPDDDIALADYYAPAVWDQGAPVHLINVTASQTVAVSDPLVQRDRKGLPLALSPAALGIDGRWYCWADADDRATPTVSLEALSVGAWIGISGAAVSPGYGRSTTLGMALLLAIANARLGHWWHAWKEQGDDVRTGRLPPRPVAYTGFAPGVSDGAAPDGASRIAPRTAAAAASATAAGAVPTTATGVAPTTASRTASGTGCDGRLATGFGAGISSKPGLRSTLAQRLHQYGLATQRYLCCELFARYKGPQAPYWHLTDGGHFDNTGAYELLRRRVGIILVCDNGADPDYECGDLANLIRLARIDFGYEFLQLGPVDLRAVDALSRLASAPGKNTRGSGTDSDVVSVFYAYRSPDPVEFARGSVLLVVKPRLHAGAPADILQYAAQAPAFPQEPTTDQFFTEGQWESYRRLGLSLAQALFPRTEASGQGLRTTLAALHPAVAASARAVLAAGRAG